MLSYRHAFHAGNHADVLKHVVLVQLARYLALKDKPFLYVDTHSGAGGYSLSEPYAQKLAEYQAGVARLWGREDLPSIVRDYLDIVRMVNPDGNLKFYPGSPYFAQHCMRSEDRLRLFELHSKDFRLLEANFSESHKQVAVMHEDGFVGLKASVPPPSRRGLVLIDPSYEEKRDYDRVLHAVRDALARFATGTYAVWYPELSRIEVRELVHRLKRLPVKNWLHVSLRVKSAPEDGIGMFGSGMFVVNPPWTLHDNLQACMPYLVDLLGQGAGASFVLEQQAA